MKQNGAYNVFLFTLEDVKTNGFDLRIELVTPG